MMEPNTICAQPCFVHATRLPRLVQRGFYVAYCMIRDSIPRTRIQVGLKDGFAHLALLDFLDSEPNSAATITHSTSTPAH